MAVPASSPVKVVEYKGDGSGQIPKTIQLVPAQVVSFALHWAVKSGKLIRRNSEEKSLIGENLLNIRPIFSFRLFFKFRLTEASYTARLGLRNQNVGQLYP